MAVIIKWPKYDNTKQVYKHTPGVFSYQTGIAIKGFNVTWITATVILALEQRHSAISKSIMQLLN